ncbi:unnamed protein product, partial [Ectocarpus sp. 4 AP-2014]
LPPFCIVLSEHRRRDTVAGPATLLSWARSLCVSKALLIGKEKIASVQEAAFVRNHEGQTTLVMHHLIGLFVSPVAWNPTRKPFIHKQQYTSMVNSVTTQSTTGVFDRFVTHAPEYTFSAFRSREQMA